jgi:hypothetical protein
MLNEDYISVNAQKKSRIQRNAGKGKRELKNHGSNCFLDLSPYQGLIIP